MEDEDKSAEAKADVKLENHATKSNGHLIKKERKSAGSTPNDSRPASRASSLSPGEVEAGSEGASDTGVVPTPKLSRKASQKPIREAPVLFDHLPDVTDEACKTYQVINDCLYGSRNMGASEHDVLDCDCTEEWQDDKNHACGEFSDCINRHTKMECVDGDCNCGEGCQNQRFQRKQYAKVSVIKTEKKGFGLRANTDLQPNDFVFEYIGEVINEPTFRNRMLRYDKEGIKHFYFMSLTKSEFVDATKKGNLGRFCNHSCSPNCYVDKWVVGKKLRMGIFATRRISAGEELVFNYNVDRYGADPQPCYCGEKNCTGFIGGKTQTERATKLPLATIEALGIEDGDSWDTAVSKKPRKKKTSENDEDYVNSFETRDLNEEGVNKVMATLMQCKEKWIAVKLLSRIQESDSEHVRHRVVRMHGYQILKTTLNTFKDDPNVVLQVLDILWNLPRLTKNKIADSNIEATVQPLASSEHETVAQDAKKLLEAWDKLETAYRIPRKKLDPSAPVPADYLQDGRRNHTAAAAERDGAKAVSLANVVIPTGPKSNVPHRNANFFNGGHRPHRKLPTNLPDGWFVTTDKTGRYYFYDKNNRTTWQRPTQPAVEEPKASMKAAQNTKSIQDIIDSITKEPTPRHSASHTPQAVSTPAPEPKKEKWRSLPVEKQMKIYENTLFPSVRYVMDKFRNKLPKEDLKKFGRDVNKKLVASDYKNNRVTDPTSITEKQEKKVKKYVRDFFERAVVKFKEHEKQKSEKAARQAGSGSAEPQATSEPTPAIETPTKDDDVVMSDLEDETETPGSGSERKRKREGDGESQGETPSDAPEMKRLKESEDSEVPSPPPPPPPPLDGILDTPTPLTEEERSMREQEEALMRENEEAQRLEEEAAAEESRRHEAGGKQLGANGNGKRLDAKERSEAQVNGVHTNGRDQSTPGS